MSQTQNIKKSRRGPIIMIVSTMVMNFSMVAYHRVMSQTLGDNYDELVALTSIINILGVFTLGVMANLAKGFAVDGEKYGPGMVKAALYRMAPKLAMGCGVIALAMLALGSVMGEYLHIEGKLPVVLMAGIFVGGLAQQVPRAAMQGLHRFGILGSSFMVEGFGRVLFSGGLVLLGFGVAGALGGSILAQIFGIAVVWLGLRKIKPDHEGLAGREATSLFEKMKDLGSDSLTLVLFSFICYMDVLVTKHHYGQEMITLVTGEQAQRAATFARASNVAKSFLYLTMALNLVLLPVVSAAKAGGRDPRVVFYRYLSIAAVILLAGLAVLWWQTPLIIRVLCGPDAVIQDRAWLVRAFSAAMIPLSLFQLTLYYHLAIGTRRLWMLVLAGVAAYFTLLNWQYDSEMNIVISVASVATVLFVAACVLSLKDPRSSDKRNENA